MSAQESLVNMSRAEQTEHKATAPLIQNAASDRFASDAVG